MTGAYPDADSFYSGGEFMQAWQSSGAGEL